jgi:hypothetical protein
VFGPDVWSLVAWLTTPKTTPLSTTERSGGNMSRATTSWRVWMGRCCVGLTVSIFEPQAANACSSFGVL